MQNEMLLNNFILPVLRNFREGGQVKQNCLLNQKS